MMLIGFGGLGFFAYRRTKKIFSRERGDLTFKRGLNMKTRLLGLAAALAFLSAASPASAAVNLISNGSFEFGTGDTGLAFQTMPAVRLRDHGLDHRRRHRRLDQWLLAGTARHAQH